MSWLITKIKKWKKCNWVGQVLRRNCLLKHVIKEKIEGMGRQRKRRKQLPDNIKGTRRYLKLKEDVQILESGEIRFQKFCVPLARQVIEDPLPKRR